MRKLFVTGGAGFIGSNIVARMAEDRDLDVVVCDRLREADLGKWKNIAKHPIGDFVAPDCESLIFGDDNFMRPYPRVRRGVVRFVVPCPDPSSEGANVPCGGRISLRTGGGRLIGKARIKRHQYEELPVRVHLTSLGRRLAGRRLGVRARVLVNGLNLPRYRWQIRLRVPR